MQFILFIFIFLVIVFALLEISCLLFFGIFKYKKIDRLKNYLERCELNEFGRGQTWLANSSMYISSNIPSLFLSYYISDRGRFYPVYRWSKQHEMITARYRELEKAEDEKITN